jgi:hypothetical protein
MTKKGYLWVGHTTVVARLWVVFVFAVAVTPGGTATHFFTGESGLDFTGEVV